MPTVDGMTTATAATSGWGLRRSPVQQLLVDSGYVLLGFPLAVASFVVLVTGFALGLGLAVTVALGVLPQPVLDLADQAALFVR